eukprot:5714045-Prymnesium_polylepis.1
MQPVRRASQSASYLRTSHKVMKRELFRLQLEGMLNLGKGRGIAARTFRPTKQMRWFALCRTNLYYMLEKPVGNETSRADYVAGCLPLFKIQSVEELKDCGLLLTVMSSMSASLAGKKEDRFLALFAATQVCFELREVVTRNAQTTVMPCLISPCLCLGTFMTSAAV